MDASFDGPEPEEIASEGVLEVAERFFAAIAANDADLVWELFTQRARDYIISVGHERGMDFDLASRLRSDTATADERADFLGDLLEGLRRDLRGVELDRLALESKAEPEAPMQERVHYLVQIGPEMEGIQTAIPAGSLVLSLENEVWRVERLEPVPSGEPGAR